MSGVSCQRRSGRRPTTTPAKSATAHAARPSTATKELMWCMCGERGCPYVCVFVPCGHSIWLPCGFGCGVACGLWDPCGGTPVCVPPVQTPAATRGNGTRREARHRHVEGADVGGPWRRAPRGSVYFARARGAGVFVFVARWYRGRGRGCTGRVRRRSTATSAPAGPLPGRTSGGTWPAC